MKPPNPNPAPTSDTPRRRSPNPAYRQAFERLDKALAEHTPSDEAQRNERYRQIFGEEPVNEADQPSEKAQPCGENPPAKSMNELENTGSDSSGKSPESDS